jgi:hypothetical protein
MVLALKEEVKEIYNEKMQNSETNVNRCMKNYRSTNDRDTAI